MIGTCIFKLSARAANALEMYKLTSALFLCSSIVWCVIWTQTTLFRSISTRSRPRMTCRFSRRAAVDVARLSRSPPCTKTAYSCSGTGMCNQFVCSG